MNWTVVIILLVIALTVLGTGIVLSYWEPNGNKVGTVEPGRLPISPYTGEEYDPAWGTMIVKGGQSNRALLKLMKTVEQEIEERDPPQSVSGIIPFGQAAGDVPDPEATYEKLELAPPDWRL